MFVFGTIWDMTSNMLWVITFSEKIERLCAILYGFAKRQKPSWNSKFDLTTVFKHMMGIQLDTVKAIRVTLDLRTH